MRVGDTGEWVERREVLRTLGAGIAGAGAALGTGTAGADPGGDHYHNPVGPPGFGDVTAIQTDDGTWYVYGTAMAIARSEDLVNWTPLGHVLEESAVDWRTNPDAGLWAPNVTRYRGEYRLYYSYSTWGSQNNPGIGLATASDPEGPFTDQGPVFRAEDLGMTNAIDGTFVLVDGTPYMVWGSFFGIHAVELTPDGRDYVPGTEFHLAGDNKEGGMIVRENGYWYLFYSTGQCCEGADSTYAVEVGRADSFFGPYYTRDGRDLREVHEHHGGTTVLSGTDRFVGPGHNTAVQDDDGNWWLLYHVEATAEREERILMLDPITWTDDDWPVVGCDGSPSARQPTPASGTLPCGASQPEPTTTPTPEPTTTVPDPPTRTTEPDPPTPTPERVGTHSAWPSDPDADGLYEDVNGNDRRDIADAVDLFQHRNDVDDRFFDFTDDGSMNIGDAVRLFRENAG